MNNCPDVRFVHAHSVGACGDEYGVLGAEEPLLDRGALLLAHAGVVGANAVVAEGLGEVAGDGLYALAAATFLFRRRPAPAGKLLPLLTVQLKQTADRPEILRHSLVDVLLAETLTTGNFHRPVKRQAPAFHLFQYCQSNLLKDLV